MFLKIISCSFLNFNRQFLAKLSNLRPLADKVHSLVISNENLEKQLINLQKYYFLMNQKTRNHDLIKEFINIFDTVFFKKQPGDLQNFLDFTSHFLSILKKSENYNNILSIFIQACSDRIDDSQNRDSEIYDKLFNIILEKNIDINSYGNNRISNDLLLKKKFIFSKDDPINSILVVKIKEAFLTNPNQQFCEDLLITYYKNKMIKMKMIKNLLKIKGWKKLEGLDFKSIENFNFFSYLLKSRYSYWEVEEFYIDDKRKLCQIVKILYQKKRNIAFSIFERNNLRNYQNFFKNSKYYEEFLKPKHNYILYENPLISNDTFKPLLSILIEYNKECCHLQHHIFKKEIIEPSKILSLDYFGIDETNVHMIENIIDLKKHEKYILSQKIIGIDMERIASEKTNSLFQLATRDKQIFLFDLLKLENEQIWPFFKTIFEKDDCLKIGQEFQSDLDSFRREKNGEKIISSNLINLQNLFKKKFVSEKKSSLIFMVEKLYNKILSKFENVGNWEKRPMKKYLIHYAALDCYLMLDIYDILNNENKKNI